LFAVGLALSASAAPVKCNQWTIISSTVNIIYHTIGRYLALPTGSIRAGQNSPYFDNYMQAGKYGPGKYDSMFARILFPNLFRRRLPSPTSKHKNCASACKFIT
jgi:hypothetical protein